MVDRVWLTPEELAALSAEMDRMNVVDINLRRDQSGGRQIMRFVLNEDGYARVDIEDDWMSTIPESVIERIDALVVAVLAKGAT